MKISNYLFSPNRVFVDKNNKKHMNFVSKKQNFTGINIKIGSGAIKELPPLQQIGNFSTS